MKIAGRAMLAAIALMFATGPALRAQDADYILATASTGGTYYPVGVALATLVKVKLQPDHGIGMSAISSEGSAENIGLMRDGEAQFGILQGLYGYYAASGTGPLAAAGPQDNLRSVTMLWQNVEHFVVSADTAQTGTMADFVALRGQRVALGAGDSGTLGSNAVLLEGLGVTIDTDFTLVFGGYGPAAEALKDGEVKGISTPGGLPVGALSKLFASDGDDLRLLSFTDDERLAADGGRDLWTSFVIPAHTYAGQSEDVTTVAQPNFLAVTGDVSEEDVYQITKAIFENLPFLQAIHPATQDISLDTAIAGLPLPLHPGALRYFKEAGVDVPDRLIAR